MQHTYQALSNGREVDQPKAAKKTSGGFAFRRGLVASLAVICVIETTILVVFATAHLVPLRLQQTPYVSNPIVTSTLCSTFTELRYFKTSQTPPTDSTFEEEPAFAHLLTVDQVRSAWDLYDLRELFVRLHITCHYAEYSLARSGLVHLENPQAHGLRNNSGVVAGLDNVYMISAFHQLHCLSKLQLLVTSLLQPSSVPRDEKLATGYHVSHCVDYLRQGIMCAADRTLEGPDMVAEQNESPLRGWGVRHICQPWDTLIEWRNMHSVLKGPKH